MAEIITADVLEWCKTYDGPKFHALLCDPPYHLTSGNVSVDWSAYNTPKGETNTDGRGHKTGFMGKKWDGGDIAFDPATWAALAEHLYPGGFGMAFASSRGWHRLACAIEDAGLRIHPSIFGWNFGTGFPKATRVKDSEAFEGHRYGLQAMKPALEPIIIFQKNYEGKPVESIVETGAGALNIDGARIGTEPGLQRPARQGKGISGGWAGYTQEPGKYGTEDGQGRWPANFYVDEEAAARLGEQSGERKPGNGNGDAIVGENSNGAIQPLRRGNLTPRNDTGTAARFFFNVNRQIDESDPVLYQAKASRKERDAGLGGLPMVGGHLASTEGGGGGWKSDSEKNPNLPRRNGHPTVKPIDLTRWLATLLLPPAEYAPRRILVPFSGSGSEMIGASLAGWEEIVGIEMEEEYVEIAEARLKHWENKTEQLKLI